jgi:hypothetical protein
MAGRLIPAIHSDSGFQIFVVGSFDSNVLGGDVTEAEEVGEGAGQILRLAGGGGDGRGLDGEGLVTQAGDDAGQGRSTERGGSLDGNDLAFHASQFGLHFGGLLGLDFGLAILDGQLDSGQDQGQFVVAVSEGNNGVDFVIHWSSLPNLVRSFVL